MTEQKAPNKKLRVILGVVIALVIVVVILIAVSIALWTGDFTVGQ